MRLLPLVFLLAACKGGPDRPFPDDFLWGTATAGFQVDMGCPTWSDAKCLDEASDWYQWVTHPDIVGKASLHVNGDPVTMGPGMWETFEADADRMVSDGFNTYRFSLEWSRLFPDGAAEAATTVEQLAEHADPDAVARYHQMLAALRERDIEPLVTLNHYTLPLWVHDGVACHHDAEACEASGWLDGERITRLISLYAGFCAKEFGQHVDLWATLNEPMATVLSGYLMPGEDRSAPPGLSRYGPGVVASTLHQIEAHAAMYDAIHAYDEVDASGDGRAAKVGVVMNMAAIHPRDPSNADDLDAVADLDHLYHRLFLDGLTDGAWDDDLDGTFDRTRPELAGRLDYVGINYYARVVVSRIPLRLVEEIPASNLYPEFSWDPYVEGLEEVVAAAERYGLPIYITENGVGIDSENIRRVGLDGHLSSLWRAIDGGADVRGYYYWSFVDNYEWNHGMDMRFGLYALDVDTKERTARPVLEDYRTIVSRNGLEGTD